MRDSDFIDLIQNLNKPSQYLGNETNAIHKEFAKQKVRVALVFPDAYEMGMSHMGQKILYDILNSMPDVVAERVFAPGLDLEKALREKNQPFFSWESKTPLKEFDVIGFSVPYELTYTNILNILDLAQIPLRQNQRSARHPLIVAGGTGAFNPEPYADFFDAVAIGDGEELVVDLVNAVLQWKQTHTLDRMAQAQGENKNDLLLTLTRITGFYIPSFFAAEYFPDGTLKAMRPLVEGYTHVEKRVVADLNAAPYPTRIIVPNTKLIHDRIGIEIQRGCTRMCRFCQAGYIERPTRQRSPERVLQIAEDSLRQTGIEEISLLSLSAGDYQTIVPTLKEMNQRYASQRISISVPATRTETLTPEMIEQVKKVRKTGFTIAPEAGTPRMRRVINKGNERRDLLKACENAFSAGYDLIKFYYMCGLPFERDEDVLGIAEESYEALKIGVQHSGRTRINVSVSSLVPKPFTPFQWVAQASIAEIERKHHLIKTSLKDKRLQFKHHDPRMSYLEGVFARGDRRLSHVLEVALAEGCRFDEWHEHFDFFKWQKVFAKADIDPNFYVTRVRAKEEVLPWDHLFSQMRKEWLWQEFEAAKNEAFLADCSLEKCAQFCGVCDFKVIKNKIFVVDDKAIAAKKGHRDWYGRFGENSPWPAPLPQKSTAEKPQEKFRYRGIFAKTGLACLHGHLELMTLFKRALQRLDIDIAYSAGFHPQMKLALGHALSLGTESLCETFDIIVNSPLDAPRFIEDLNAAMPKGIVVSQIESIDFNALSLYSVTKSMHFEVHLPKSFEAHQKETLLVNLEKLKMGEKLMVERNRPGKKTKMLCLNDLVLAPQLQDSVLSFSNVCVADGMLKPNEVLMALANSSASDIAGLKIKKVGIDFAASTMSVERK